MSKYILNIYRMNEYLEFLDKKKYKRIESGFIAPELNKALFPFQKYIVTKALSLSKYAIFADCGLGKTLMQLEWSRRVSDHTGRPVLILCPLAVKYQTKLEAEKFNISLDNITIENYDQLDNLNPSDYAGIVLDESSILKSFDGATKKQLIGSFANTEYKLCCTATPSPNDPMELGNHSEFLNVMSMNQMLAMYFVHDGGDTGMWRIKRHGRKHFWNFVSTWACMVCKPEDIGFPMPGYNLPCLNLIEHKIIASLKDNGQIFNDMAVSATNFNEELRRTKTERLGMAARLANESTEQFIIWIKQNEEGEYLRKLIQGSVEVAGSDKTEYKEQIFLEFSQGKHRVLISKIKIASFGLNFQNCHNQIFASLDFSFEGLYQGIRRSYRFGQEHEVNIHLVTTDTMTNVISSINQKQKRFEEMQQEMNKEINPEYVKENNIEDGLQDFKNEKALLLRGDCVQRIKQIPDNSIGFSIFSPPFAELYTYSDELADMGNSKDYNEFLFAFKFLVKELYRVLWSGRNIAVHCMDLPIQKGKEGYIGLRDFSGMIRAAFEEEEFIYHSRVTLWKDPVTEMQRTKALGLLHKQVRKDAAMSRVGLPDYLLVFRKPGDHLHPVNCAIPVDTWQKYASPVWMDIDYSNTLNGREGRGEFDEKHICPLQLGTIERAIHLWTNAGDTVLTPFMGVGSEAYQAVKMKRNTIGIELKQSYFDAAIKNIKTASITQSTIY